jgi:hypothetical protein
MGCDIHSYVEQKIGNRWEDIEFHPFRDRDYSVFAFMVGVRNYSDVTPLAQPRGLPEDMAFMTKSAYQDWKADAHSMSWLSLKEMAEFDYEAEMEDRRITVQTGPNSWDGGRTSEPGGGKTQTWREFLPNQYFRDLEMLKAAGAPESIRVVFWFDN